MTTTFIHKDTYLLNNSATEEYAEFVPNGDGTVTVSDGYYNSSVVYSANDAKSLFYSLIRQGYIVLL